MLLSLHPYTLQRLPPTIHVISWLQTIQAYGPGLMVQDNESMTLCDK